MAIVIAGERSGSGKTTITLALLAALRQQRYTVQSFKVGPDYIDPMFHTAATGRPCRNLDPVLTSEAYVQQCFAQHSQFVDCAVVEGVMGLFDGAGGQTDFASTAHIARLLELPIALVIDCARLSRSVAAIAQGYRTLDPRLNLAGVILNRVGSDRHLTLLQEALDSIHMPILGIFRREAAIAIPDRHLGLIPTEELTEWKALQDRLAHLGLDGFNWPQLLPLLSAPNAGQHPSFSLPKHPPDRCEYHHPTPQRPVRIAVARDRAFNFYYADNLECLTAQGAELVFWSPLQDTQLPDPIHGLYLGGGFPEVFAGNLSTNIEMKAAIRTVIQSGTPTYAECGGMMYLCENIVDFQEQVFPMLGLLPTNAVMSPKLTLGYRRAEAQNASSLLTPGSVVIGHEFHRSHLTHLPTQPLFSLCSYTHPEQPIAEGWSHCGHFVRSNTLHASYLHLHWGATPKLVERFVTQCRAFVENATLL